MATRVMSFGFVFGLLLLVIAAAFYVPTVVEDPTVDRELTTNQTDGEEIEVYNQLNATISDVNQTNQNLTVTLEDTDTGDTNETELDVATAEDLELSGSTVTVNVTAINTDSHAEMSYTYPPTFGWPDGMKTVADNLAIIFMGFVAFLLFGFIWFD